MRKRTKRKPQTAQLSHDFADKITREVLSMTPAGKKAFVKENGLSHLATKKALKGILVRAVDNDPRRNEIN